jgi:hypothetical protein
MGSRTGSEAMIRMLFEAGGILILATCLMYSLAKARDIRRKARRERFLATHAANYERHMRGHWNDSARDSNGDLHSQE